jgi:hypothetical protein
MPVQRDYILRLIESIAAVVRRLREQLSGRGTAPETVLQEARGAQAELFGETWMLLQRVDVTTATSLIRDTRQLDLWSELVRIEAEAHRLANDEASAEDADRRALMIENAVAARKREGRA